MLIKEIQAGLSQLIQENDLQLPYAFDVATQMMMPDRQLDVLSASMH